MSRELDQEDVENTEELFEFLQGRAPEGYVIRPGHLPKLTPDQAWTVIWYLGNKYWQVTDHVERCEVCGDIYNSWCEGECLDFGHAPYNFCGNCCDGEEAKRKRRIGRQLQRSKKHQLGAEVVTEAGEDAGREGKP